MAEVSWAQVRRRRLARQWLLERGAAGELTAIAAAVCGIHAQVAPAAELSFGMRADVTRNEVRNALWKDRSLVKTYGVRGTLHVFAAADVRLFTAAQRARRSEAWEAKRFASLGLTEAQVEAIIRAMDEALAGRALTLKELGEEVVRRTGPWAAEAKNDYWASGWPNWRIALGTAARREVLCFGPPRGQEVTLVRLDDWIGSGRRLDERQALREVLRRFLHAYGPVPPAAFTQWFELPVQAARELFASMRDELVEVNVGGMLCVRLAADVDFGVGEARPAPVRLLPHFDCYLRGFFPRQELGADHATRAAGGTGRFPVLLIDGQVAGVWERRVRRGRVIVRVDAFVPLRKRQLHELESEAARVGRVLETEAELELDAVEVRAHL